MHDLVIIGGGPAGAAAGVYAARKKLNTLLVAQSFGGQSTVSPEIQNWIGEKNISGEALARKLKEHVFVYQGNDFAIKEGTRATKIDRADHGFTVHLSNNLKEKTRTILLAAGAERRRLEVPGAAEFEQKGVTYCASCDGPLFGGKEVVVIGGGNAGFETASQLLAYAKNVSLLQHNDRLKADPVTVERIRKNPRFKIILNASIQEIRGDKFVKALVYRETTSGEIKELPAEGIFVEIGLKPNTDLVKDLVALNRYGMVTVNHQTQQTSLPGIWAAGDCTDVLYHQNNISAGDAIKAVENIYQYLSLR